MNKPSGLAVWMLFVVLTFPILLSSCTSSQMGQPPDTNSPAVVSTQPPESTQSPDPTLPPAPPLIDASREVLQIVFASDRDGKIQGVGGMTDLYGMAGDGSHVQRLTFTENAAEQQPKWSPSGEQIAFLRWTPPVHPENAATETKLELVRMKADGSGETIVPPAPIFPVGTAYIRYFEWSPDGDFIVFTTSSNATADIGIWVVSLNGSDPRQVAAVSGAYVYPDWSADGQSLAFASEMEGRGAIYTIRREGANWSAVQRLTENITIPPTPSDAPAPPAISWCQDPAWSPVSPLMVYTCDYNLGRAFIAASPDGSTNVEIMWGGYGGEPVWSPDGMQIAFMSNVVSAETEGFSLWILKMTDLLPHEPYLLAEFPKSAGGLSWSPDGTQIVFSQQQLPPPNSNSIEPGLEPSDIWVIDMNGNTVNLTNQPTADNSPDWRP